MSANKILIIAGALVILIPLLGLPAYFETVILICIGCVMIAFAILSHIRRRSALHDKTGKDSI